MKKVTIIAEIGINHNGSVNLAKRMIKAAKKSGADIVKFQTGFRDQLFKLSSKDYRVSKKFILNKSDFIKIKKYCDQIKIEFLSTPYDLKSVDLLEELNVKRYKIASADLVDTPLHKKILSTKKPIIMSVGMATISEIKKAIDLFKKNKMLKITLLHCVSSYPCSLKSLNLKVIPKLKRQFNLPVGYSDHSLGNDATIISVSLGATIIEKHFTIDKSLPGPDQKISANPKEFSSLVNAIRKTEIILGKDKKKCQPEERKFLKSARKSVTLEQAMKRGAILKEKDIIMKRPGTGINGQKIYLVAGKRLRKNFPRDYQIKKKDLI
jgi:sialic acid synthase SpsE|tara:strand:- start:1044 stop:2012 length:969 start_codon:yes stop_codon:yes gene_type:complete